MIRATEQQSYNKLFAECYSTHFQKTFNAGKRIPKEQQKFADYLQRGVISYSSVTQLFFIGISTTYFDFAHVAKSIVPLFQPTTSLRVDV